MAVRSLLLYVIVLRRYYTRLGDATKPASINACLAK
jgi:hypothetical protein